MVTRARGNSVDALAKHINTIPLNNIRLFEGCLSSAIAKAATFTQDYQAMADGFVQAGMHRPTVAML